MFACKGGHLGTVRTLLSYSANTSIKNKVRIKYALLIHLMKAENLFTLHSAQYGRRITQQLILHLSVTTLKLSGSYS